MLSKLTGRTRSLYDNSINQEVEFSFDLASEYRIENIDGLGPVKSDLSTVNTPLDAGGIYLSSKDGMRNVVVTVEFNPNHGSGSTVAALRQKLYTVYTPGNKIELELETLLYGTLHIKGTVEANEPVIFSKDPQNQISILCTKPYFRSDTSFRTYVVPVASFPLFSVPFEGLVTTGFTFEFEVVSPIEYFQLHAEPAMGRSYLSLNMSFLAGDVVKFSTVPGDRYVTYTRDGVTKSALGYFRGSLVDMQLNNGLNYFTFEQYASMQNIQFGYEIVYGGL